MAAWKRSVAAAWVALAVGLGVVLSGCGGGGPMDTTCGEYLEKSEATQLTLASQWSYPDQSKPSPEYNGTPWREKLLAYCSNSSSKDTKLKEIVPTGP